MMKRTRVCVYATLLLGLAIGTAWTLLDGVSARARLSASTVQDDAKDETGPDGEGRLRRPGKGAVIFQPGTKVTVAIAREDNRPWRRLSNPRASYRPTSGAEQPWSDPEIVFGRNPKILILVFTPPARVEADKVGPDEVHTAGSSGVVTITVEDSGEDVVVTLPAEEVEFDPCSP